MLWRILDGFMEQNKDIAWVETVSGKKFHFLDPQPEEIDIIDIATALGNNCRYTGQCRGFYSVAEHSVAVSELTGNSLEGLLHDASEAYLQDIASPVKAHLHNYKELEAVVMQAILLKFGADYPYGPAIKYADVIQLSTEARHLLPSKGNDWNWEWIWPEGRPKRFGIIPRFLSPKKARDLFLRKYEEITS